MKCNQNSMNKIIRFRLTNNMNKTLMIKSSLKNKDEIKINAGNYHFQVII